ncbi:matrixin family metalloprotease [Flavobacterium sp. N1736]|uniref:matrixin family metalloprotease n=1 Tax=Flavobacterium sp. N1736 TaxID=2986823 RepID=UPI0022253C01|nr:matrixin family metalloprotease [Flavobacterium sp. N1736]
MKKLKFIMAGLAFIFLCCEKDNQTTPNPFSNTNERDICTFDLINSKNNIISKPEAVITDLYRWKTGQVIKIKFLDGDIPEQELVKKYVNEWAMYVNLKFEYVPITEYAHIRIAFYLGDNGAWSVLGMSNVSSIYDQSKPTMRLGSLKVAKEEWAAQTILHEFGHALGLQHETKNPAATIKWDLPQVYKFYSDMGWTKEEVDEQIINKVSSTNYSEYDPLSIMHYYIPPSLTTDGIGVREQYELSIIDKKSINQWYPFPIVSILDSGQSIHDLPWNKRIKSPNGKYALEFDLGLLQVIDLTDNKVIWEAGNSNYRRKPSCYFESTTGNIIIKGARVSGIPTIITWTSNTAGFPGAKLHLQDDGNLELIHNGIVRWSSKTGKL